MRVGDRTFYLRFLAGLAAADERTARGLDGLTDGKQVRRASDDPSGHHTSLALRARLTRIAGFDRSANAARTDLATIDNALGAVIGLLTEARTEALAGASGPYDTSNDARAEVVEQLRNQLLSLANTEQGGRYLFGGTETAGTPFDPAGSYAGNDDEVLAPLDTQQLVGSTLSGRRVFLDGGDLFGALDDITQALRDNRTGDVANLIPTLTVALDHVSEVRADVGARMQGIDASVDRHSDETLTLARRIGEIENVDLAELVVRLQEAESASSALSAAAARILGRSLFDFLG